VIALGCGKGTSTVRVQIRTDGNDSVAGDAPD
jgi:hypothetical protein